MSEIKSLLAHRALIKQFIKREIAGRYKGSYLGIVWSFINPMLMLVIYTFVFSVVFSMRWGMSGETTGKVEFAMVLFAGLLVFNLFSEVISKAPSLISSNVNYVKKVVFPLEILPIVSLGSAVFHAAISLGILVIAMIVLMGTINWTLIFFPLILLPFCLVTLGIAFFLASLGVYVKDIGQVVSVFIPGIMFLSPIFYPISAIPKELQFLYWINPISYVVEDARRVIVWGQLPHWTWLGLGILIGIAIAILGYTWFKKTRKGFADVI